MTIYRTLSQKCAPALLLASLSLSALHGIAQTATPEAVPDTAVSDAAKVNRESPRYLLMGTNGRSVMAEDFRERFQLIAFGFVSCPDVCPTTLLEMQQVLAALGDKAKHLQAIFITIDPQRDTLEVLKAYTANFDKRILGLTGSDALVRFAANNFKVEYTKVQEPGAAPNVYTMDHTAGMFLLGPDGQLLKKFAYRTPVQDITTQINTWMDENGRLELSKPKP
jgi:protein SCO1/2